MPGLFFVFFIYLFILSLTTAWNTEVRCEFIYIYIDCLLYFRLYLFRKLLNAIVKFTFISLKNLVQNSSRDISPKIVSSRYYSFGILRNGSYFFFGDRKPKLNGPYFENQPRLS